MSTPVEDTPVEGTSAETGAPDGRRVDLVPLHHLEALGGGRWLAQGNDPYFRLEVPADCLRGGFLRITAWLEGARVERPCLYLDTGVGWNEAGRVELRADGPGCWTTVSSTPPLAGPARFDPSEQPGPLHLHALHMERLPPQRLLLELLDQEVRAAPASAPAVLGHARELERAQGVVAACEWLLSGGAHRLRGSEDPYLGWIDAHDTLSPEAMDALRVRVDRLPERPLLSLVLPLADGQQGPVLACVESVLAQVYPDWELLLVGDPELQGWCDAAVAATSRVRWIAGRADDARALNRALESASGRHVAILEGAPRLAPHALMALADAVAGRPDLVMVHADSDRVDVEGRRHSPEFRPAWDPDLFLARDYVGAGALFDLGKVRAAGGFRPDHPQAMLADLALRCLGDADVPVLHLPLVLLHWPDGAREGGAQGGARRVALARYLDSRVLSVEPAGRDGARLRWPLPDPVPRVSIIVPTRDRLDLLRQCVESILSRSTYPDLELLVVDNGSVEADTLAYLAALESRSRVRVLRDDRPFNYSAINNRAVAQASGEVIALVNNDIEVLTPDWLEEMVSQALRPGVGAVGAMLYYPDDTIQHAGVVLGLGGVAGHVHSRQPRATAGETGAAVARAASAVTGACLVVRRAAWEEVGGLDERLQVAFNDIDFCLRLRAAGYRNLWTPHAELYHHESASRGSEDTEDKLRRFHSEVAFMVERWGDQLDDDPAYNPNLSLLHGAANKLASPPRSGLQAWLRHMGVRDAAARQQTGRWTPR